MRAWARIYNVDGISELPSCTGRRSVAQIHLGLGLHANEIAFRPFNGSLGYRNRVRMCNAGNQPLSS